MGTTDRQRRPLVITRALRAASAAEVRSWLMDNSNSATAARLTREVCVEPRAGSLDDGDDLGDEGRYDYDTAPPGASWVLFLNCGRGVAPRRLGRAGRPLLPCSVIQGGERPRKPRERSSTRFRHS